MPSIPQSLLWISLVVLWLFVLVPMLISRRDAVRRTSDVALATRVLNSGASARLLRRGRPAAGHRHDPDWQPEDEHDDLDDDIDEEAEAPKRTRSVVVVTAVAEEAEPDYLDVDVVDEDSGALPVGAGAAEAAEDLQLTDDETAEPVFDDETTDMQPVFVAEDADAPAAMADEEPDYGSHDGTSDEYEYVEDTSGLEAEEDPSTTMSPAAERRRRYESNTAAAVSARKYKFRKRVLLTMAAILVGSAAAAFTVAPSAWWVCGSAAVVTVLYLAYLRRQTRIEEQLRRRRMQRMARSRMGVENADDREFEVVPSRLRQPGAAVLEIDDEDPVFEHLDDIPFARDYDLPRAAGQ
jgi:predicted transcriptional regulator